jgi:succinate-semialdehyde dehydrogenase/glutarate-semialdehyde dehydrogenase
MVTHFIAGVYVRSNGTATRDVINPATGEVVETVPRGTVGDVNDAVQAAKDAFPGWWDTPAAKRGLIMYKAVRAIRENVEELAHCLTREQGKPLAEARMEIHRFAYTIEHYAGLAKNLRGGYVPNLDEKAHGLIIKRPYGVCAAIVPWNFPVSLMGNKVGPALVAGNTMVIKPAETTPLTDVRVIEVMTKAGLPPGVLNVVTGQGSVVGQALLEHADIAKVGFTGSTEVGRQVMASAAKTIKRVTLELGGSDPIIVCDDANIDKAVSAASVGRFFNCGQACLAVKRMFVFDAVVDEFTDKLVAKVNKLTIGPGTEKGVRLGPLHTKGQRAEVEGQVQDAVERGAQLLTGGRRPDGVEYENGNFYLPTVLTNVDPASKVLTEEVFGPAVPVVPVRDLDEAIERANDSIFGLGSSIWTSDLDKATRAAEKLEAGYTWINSITKIYDELPFGGFKQSGVGQEHGIEAIDHYMATKSVVVKRLD